MHEDPRYFSEALVKEVGCGERTLKKLRYKVLPLMLLVGMETWLLARGR